MIGCDKLKEIIKETNELLNKSLASSDPEFHGWLFKVKKFIHDNCYEDSLEMKEFNEIKFLLGIFIPSMSR